MRLPMPPPGAGGAGGAGAKAGGGFTRSPQASIVMESSPAAGPVWPARRRNNRAAIMDEDDLVAEGGGAAGPVAEGAEAPDSAGHYFGGWEDEDPRLLLREAPRSPVMPPPPPLRAGGTARGSSTGGMSAAAVSIHSHSPSSSARGGGSTAAGHYMTYNPLSLPSAVSAAAEAAAVTPSALASPPLPLSLLPPRGRSQQAAGSPRSVLLLQRSSTFAPNPTAMAILGTRGAGGVGGCSTRSLQSAVGEGVEGPLLPSAGALAVVGSPKSAGGAISVGGGGGGRKSVADLDAEEAEVMRQKQLAALDDWSEVVDPGPGGPAGAIAAPPGVDKRLLPLYPGER